MERAKDNPDSFLTTADMHQQHVRHGMRGRRGGEAMDVANSYVNFIRSIQSPHVILYADNCASQNENKTLFSAMITLLN